MNKNRYRIIFNQSRGVLMAVAEFARALGKNPAGSRPATACAAPSCFLDWLRPIAGSLLLAFLIQTPAALAQVVAYRAAPGGQQPTVLNAPNGVPLINIQTPSAAGVSRNTYSQFDVQNQGVILNNSRNNAQTQLGGWVQGNPWLATGSARVILNEVVSGAPSQLFGMVEVAGSAAQIVIANPAGLTCNGCGFINASRATLTTGTPLFSDGNLTGYRVAGGSVRIEGAGLDASRVSHTEILARAVEVNAGLWAQTLNVTTGVNDIRADDAHATPVASANASTDPAPVFAIDVAQLGGMYANKITLVGTEAGVGVRNAGTIGAMVGEAMITADGKLVNKGTISGSNGLALAARGVDNSGTLASPAGTAITSLGDVSNTGLISAGRELKLDITGQLNNTQGTLDGQRLDIGANGLINDQGTIRQNGLQALALNVHSIANSQGGLIGNVIPDVNPTDPVNTSALAESTAPTTAAGGGSTATSAAAPELLVPLADGVIAIRGNVTNANGIIAASGAMDVTATAGLQNSATLNVNRLNVSGGPFSNVLGKITATDVHVNTAVLDNSQGQLTIGNTFNVNAQELRNAQGTLTHTGSTDLAIALPGNFDNTGGLFATNATQLDLSAATLNNTGGTIHHAGSGNLNLTANQLQGNNGQIESKGTLNLTAQNALLNGASTVAEKIAITAGSLSNQGGEITQNGSGSGNDSGHINIAGTLDNQNNGSIVSNGALQLNAGSFANNGGKLSVGQQLTANVAGALNNASGQIVSGTDLSLTAGSVDNSSGTLGSVAGQLNATITGALNNTSGRIEAVNGVTLSSQGLNNTQGTVLGQTLVINTQNQTLDNTQGRLVAGGTMNLQTGMIVNATGLIQSDDALTINTHGQSLINTASGSNGGIYSQTTATLATGAVDNTTGTIGAGDALTLAATGNIANQSGRLVGQNNVALSAAQLDNQSGNIQSAGDLTINAGSIANQNGLLRAGQTLTATTASLNNASTQGSHQGIEGGAVNLTVQQLNNQSGAIRADTTLAIHSAGTLNNSSGLISSEQSITVEDSSAVKTLAVDNTSGTFVAGQALGINAASLTGNGKLLSQGDLSLKLVGNYNNISELTANGNIHLETTGNISNDATIQTGGALSLTATAIDNTATGQILASDLHLVAGTLTNRGLIDGQVVRIDAGVLNNLGGGRIYGDYLAIGAGVLNNTDEGGMAPVIAARDQLDLGVGTLNNTNGALIFSAGDLAIGGALDADGYAIGMANAINNTSATIEALGNLAINTASLNNQKANFATQQVPSTDIPTGTALLAYAPDLQFHWPIAESSGITWRNYLRDRYINVIVKLLGGGPDAALVEHYNPTPDPDAPPPPEPGTSPYENFTNIWGNLAGYTGPVGGGLSDAYRAELIAAINAQPITDFQESMALWNFLLQKIQADHPEYLAAMAQTLTPTIAGQGFPLRSYNQSCWDMGDDCSYVLNSITQRTDTKDIITADSPSAIIRAGGHASINAGALINRYSLIQSGGDMELTGATLTNVGAELYQFTDTTTLGRLWHWVNNEHESYVSAGSTQTLIGGAPGLISAGGTLTGSYTGLIDNQTIRQNTAPVTPPGTGTPGDLAIGSAGQSASGAGTATTSGGPANGVGHITQVTSSGANGPDQVIATLNAVSRLPNNSLMHLNPNAAGQFLIETDPRFTNYRQWLGSDYLLNALALDPATTQKRLGDGFYEQRLITEQIGQLTGRRFLEGYSSDEAQYRALMDAGITLAREWNLVPGVALSAAQMAALTTDIVWLVEQTVTLPDGSTRRALVPQVYARVRSGDLAPSGALIAADNLHLETAGDLVTSGTLAGRQLVSLQAENIDVLRGRITGRDLIAQANRDLTVRGGSLEAEHTLIASAGNDLTVESTTVDRNYRAADGKASGTVSRTSIDRVAGLYVTGANGVLVAAAGHDLNLIGAAIVNAGPAGSSQGNAGPSNRSAISTPNNTGNTDNTSPPTPTENPGSATLLSAGNDLNLGTVSESNNATTQTRSRSSRSNWHEATRTDVGSQVATTGDLTLTAGHDLTARAATVVAEGALSAHAGNDLTITTGEASYAMEVSSNSKKGGIFRKKTTADERTIHNTTALSSTFAGENVSLSAGNDLTVRGSNVSAADQLTLSARRDVIIDTAQETHNESHLRTQKESGVSSSNSGLAFAKSSQKENSTGHRTTQVGSTLTGEDVAIIAGRDTTIRASNVLADQDITVLAGRDVNILAAANTQDTTYHFEQKSTAVGFHSGLSGRFTIYGSNEQSQDNTGQLVEHSTSLLSANQGNLIIRAGLDEQYKGTGHGKLTTQGADLLAGERISLSGNAIDLQAVTNQASSHSIVKTKSVTVGASLAGAIGEKLQAIGDAVERATNTDNDRLAGALTLKAGYDAYKLGQGKDVPKTTPTGTDTTPGSSVPGSTLGNGSSNSYVPEDAVNAPGASTGMAQSGFGIQVSINSSKSRSETNTHDTAVMGTNLQARNIDITATETDIHMAAAKLQAENITLTAERDILLEAAANTSELKSRNSGSSFGSGVTFGFGGQQNGISFQANASVSKGKTDGSETHWDNTLITASDNLTLVSGRDTTLQGAQLAGNHVSLDVGRDLLIETLQDRTVYTSQQKTSGFDISLCIPPICYGMFVTGSITHSAQKIKHNYLSAVGQSGLTAGEGGFDINVGGHTQLIGAAITSTADEERNSLSTASLAYRDLENEQKTKASSSSITLAYGGGSAIASVAGNVTQNTLNNLNSNAALPKNEREKGTTQSVISPATISIMGASSSAIDEASKDAALTLMGRDPATANESLTNNLSLQQAQDIQKDIRRQQENQEAAKLVGSVMSTAIGDYAQSRNQELQAQENARAKAANEPAQQITDWADGSPQKLALHGLAGLASASIGKGNLAAGALGGMGQEALAPAMSQFLKDNGYDYEEIKTNDPNLTSEERQAREKEYQRVKSEHDSLLQMGMTLAGATAGSLVGGIDGAATGASTAFIGVKNNFLKHAESLRMTELRNKQRQGECGTSCEQEIATLDAEDKRRNAMLDACQGVNTPDCNNARQEVRYAAAEYIRKEGTVPRDGNIIDVHNTYTVESAETRRYANGTLDGRAWGMAQGAAGAVMDTLSALGSLAGNVGGALGGDDASYQALKNGAGATWEYVSNTDNWPYLIGAMTPQQREELAQAYESGDGNVVGKLMGEQTFNILSNVSTGGTAGLGIKLVKTADKVGDAARIVDRVEDVAKAAKGGAKALSTGISKDVNATIKTINSGGDNLLSTTAKTSAGDLQILAEVRANGTQLQLDSFTVYGSNGSVAKNSVLRDIFSAKNDLIQAAKENGFTEIRIIGKRVENSSSASPGKQIDMIIKVK